MSNIATSTNIEDYNKAGGNSKSAENQRIIGKLVDREVIHCASMLVYHFARNTEALKGSDYSEDDIYELCSKRVDKSEEIAEIDERIDEAESSLTDLDDEADEIEAERDGATDADLADLNERADVNGERREELEAEKGKLEAQRADLKSEDGEDTEALEHWIVSTWLKNRLEQHGEIVGELFGLDLWGRQCSGQSIKLDYVMQEIAAEMGILDGQAYSWKD